MAKKEIKVTTEKPQKEISQKTKTQTDKTIKIKVEDNKKQSPKTVKKSSKKKASTQKERTLSIREKAFCREYVKSGNGLESVRKAGYSASSDNVGSATASRLLRRAVVQQEIARLLQRKEDKAIATADDVMRFFTRCMNGEEKDQFGLDISAADKIKAAQELAKRTIDIDNRIKGVPDNTVSIKVDWRKS